MEVQQLSVVPATRRFQRAPVRSLFGAALEADGRSRRVGFGPSLRQHAPELLGVGVIGLVLLGLFGRAVVPGVIGLQRDTGSFYYPLTAWFAQELQAGRFPLWCPLIFGGYPLLADGEIGMLYPPNVLALLMLPTDLAFVLIQATNYFVAGLGTYALARVLGVGRLAAVYAGLTFSLGGFMVGHLDHANILRSAAWLPALLCCGELGLRARRLRVLGWTALAAACLALAGLGLHPQILLIDLVSLWIYLPLRALALLLKQRAIAARRRRVSLGSLPVVLGGTSLLGLAGATAQLAPTYELAMLSSRGGGVPYPKATAGALSWFDLLTLVLPSLFRADPRNVWSLYPYWETTLYIGAIGVLLALVGLALGRPRVVLPLAGLAGVGLALAMANYFPLDLYGALWHLPGYSAGRMPGRYSLVVELALAVLAGIGLERLRGEAGVLRARRAVRVVSGLAVAVIVGLAGVRLWVAADEAGSLQAIQAAYLSLPRDRPALSAEQVRGGLLAALDVTNPPALLTLAALLTALVLFRVCQRWPRVARRAQLALVVLGAGELLLVAHSFHPTAPIGVLAEASAPVRFLSAQEGLWRAFLVGRSDTTITSRPAQFTVAQAYGYSSLPTARMERYWTRVNKVDDELLDLWNARYVVESKRASGRIWAQDVLFDPARPLLDGPADSPLGHEVFRVTPTQTDAVRLLSGMKGAAALPDGTIVAEVVISGSELPPERLMVRLGAQTAEAAHDELKGPAHARATVGYAWEPRDPDGRVYPRNIYVADLRLAQPRAVERVEVRTLAPAGQFRLSGLALRDQIGGTSGSLLASHREKYVVAYEDARTVIYENHASLPRAFVVGQAVTVEPDGWAVEQLLQPGFDSRRQVLLERAGARGTRADPAAAPIEPGRAQLISNTQRPQISTLDVAVVDRYGTDHGVVRATSGRGGYLVMTDSFYPGWRAWLDGREVPIERANSLFRAVALPPGEHVVEFSFQPRTIYVGGWISLVAWATMLGLGMVVLRRRASPRCRPEPARRSERHDQGDRESSQRACQRRCRSAGTGE